LSIIADGESCVIRDATVLSTKVSGNILVKSSGVATVMASSAQNIREEERRWFSGGQSCRQKPDGEL